MVVGLALFVWSLSAKVLIRSYQTKTKSRNALPCLPPFWLAENIFHTIVSCRSLPIPFNGLELLSCAFFSFDKSLSLRELFSSFDLSQFGCASLFHILSCFCRNPLHHLTCARAHSVQRFREISR